MGARSFISSMSRLIKLIQQPDREELWLSMRISLLGIGLIGVIGFIIKFISAMIQATPAGA